MIILLYLYFLIIYLLFDLEKIIFKILFKKMNKEIEMRCILIRKKQNNIYVYIKDEMIYIKKINLNNIIFGN